MTTTETKTTTPEIHFRQFFDAYPKKITKSPRVLTIAWTFENGILTYGLSLCRPTEVTQHDVGIGAVLLRTRDGDVYNRKIGNTIAKGRLMARRAAPLTPLGQLRMSNAFRMSDDTDLACAVLMDIVETHPEGDVSRVAYDALEDEQYNKALALSVGETRESREDAP